MKRGVITFIFGLILGTAVGLYFGWFVFPVEWIDVLPAELAEEDQNSYLVLIAATYAAEENLINAQQRLAGLGREDWRPWLLGQAVDAVLVEPFALETAHLVQLALDLGLESPAFVPYEDGSQSETEQAPDG